MKTGLQSKILFYIDVNNAFLSWTAVELLKGGYSLDIRTIPAIVAGDETQRQGIVLAKSPVAKSLGIKTGDTIRKAKEKAPNLRIYSVDFDVYNRYSDLLNEYYRTYTDKVCKFSIDESCLDMTGCIMVNETPEILARRMADEIKQKWGFTVNVGIAPNRLLAKMASDLEKPNKVHTLYPDEIETKMWPLPVNDLNMAGRKTCEKLNMLGIRTIGDLAKYDEKVLVKRLGKLGRMLHEYANGIDDEELSYEVEKPKGIGNSTTMPEDVKSLEKLERVLLGLCEETTYRLRKEKMIAATVSVQIKNSNFVTRSHQGKLDKPTASTKKIYEKAKELLKDLHKGEAIRLVGVRVENLMETQSGQMSLFDDGKNEKLEKLDVIMDGLKDKFGSEKIRRAGDL